MVENGHFVAKIFRGGAESDLLQIVKQNFKKVKHFKPKSSRKESSEFYLIAIERKETFNKRRPVTIWEKNNTLDC